MNIVFRADASVEIGTGHIMRSLVLADKLREQGANISFICRSDKGHYNDCIISKGYKVSILPPEQFEWKIDAEQTINILKHQIQYPDCLVIDHYALDIRWEQQLRGLVKRIAVIDDLANRPHDCDILLDPNLYQRMEFRYEHLVPAKCMQFLGPQYALLRPEFREERRLLRIRDGTVRRILIFFGGTDPTNETLKTLQAVEKLKLNNILVDVVVGDKNPHKSKVEQICSTLPNVTYYCQIDFIAWLMTKADLSIGAGGSTTWERLYLGLPTLTMTIADNQMESINMLDQLGVIWNLGWHENVSVDQVANTLHLAINDETKLRNLSHAGMSLAGDKLEEVCQYIINLIRS